MTSKVIFFIILAIVTTGYHAAYASLDRPKDPVVLTGSDISSLIGSGVGNVVGFRYQGGWQQIPIQIDERDLVDLDKPYDGQGTSGPTGFYAMQYNDPNTFTGADTNPQFDGDDELVFMAFDAGGKASGPEPAGVIAGSGLEVHITDPLDSGEGYVYLFLTDGSLAPGAGQQYVNYTFNVIGCSNYLSCYDIGGANPENSTVITSAYSLHFSEMWVHDGMQITVGGSTGTDFLDRQRIALAPNSGYRNEDTFSNSRGCFIVSRGGPIRALRCFMGSNSGVYNQLNQKFYAQRMDQILNHRVHPMYSASGAFDYTAQAIGMRYHSDVHPGGVTIDGIPDSISTAATTWEMATGNHGTLVVAHLPIIHDIPTLAINTYYIDEEPPSESQASGDAHTYGVHGFWLTGIPNTDPNVVNEPLHHLTVPEVLYFDGPDKAVADAQTAYQCAATNLSVAVSPYDGILAGIDDVPSGGHALSIRSCPNPFKAATVIWYDLPESGGAVTLHVYDLGGRLVRTLVDRAQTGGEKSVTWDGRDNRGRRVASGVYFYRLEAPGYELTGKTVLVQ